MSPSANVVVGETPGECGDPCGRIVQLDETVINRIAAGEVVVRPANALKELMENCLDAGSTQIVVSVKAGGLKMLRIEDDGHGIRHDDLPILCERFTTSKLRKYDDLACISTFGFRGEALASISHVAHLTVTTMSKSDTCAHVAQYTDSKLRGPPRPCAGTRGTTIVAEDMFYNNSTRRQALGKDSVEHAKVLEVVQRYSLHNPSVSFSCRKLGSNSSELHTPGGSASSLDVASIVHGEKLAKELFQFEAHSDKENFKCRGLASGPNYTTKSCCLILFINNRLVESSTFRRAIDAVYSTVLPRHQHPWVYLALDLDPLTLDVNVHPTKMEVQFLHEQIIAEKVQEALGAHLRESGASRTFNVQTTLFHAPSSTLLEGPEGASVPLGNAEPSRDSSSAKPQRAEKRPHSPKRVDLNPLRVRTDHQQQSLASALRKSKSNLEMALVADGGPSEDDTRRAIFAEAQSLSSISELKAELRRAGDAKLSKALLTSVYVGPATRELALLQCGPTLCLVNIELLARECAYQQLLRCFGCVSSFVLRSPLPLRATVRLGIMDPGSGYDSTQTDVDLDDLTNHVAGVLQDKAEMLQEYVGFRIENDHIVALPNALDIMSADGVCFDSLPLFLVRLSAEVDWTEEKTCFHGLCRTIADFCVDVMLPDRDEPVVDGRSRSDTTALNAAVEQGEFPDIVAAVEATRKRSRSGAPNALEKLRWLHQAICQDASCVWQAEAVRDGTVLELVSLDQLYRIFERC